MGYRLEAVAVALMLAGLVLVGTGGTSVVGTVLVAGGAYALVLPTFIEPHGPATR